MLVGYNKPLQSNQCSQDNGLKRRWLDLFQSGASYSYDSAQQFIIIIANTGEGEELRC